MPVSEADKIANGHLDRVSGEAKQMEITDKRGVSKVHVFRFYKDRHVTYNQRICGRVFYSRFQRVNSTFGYAEYLQAARLIMKAHFC